MPVFNGTPGPDTIEGSSIDDTINGGAGNDLISGNGLDDSIVGGSGNDTIGGDEFPGTPPGIDASALLLSIDNVRPGSETAFIPNSAQAGDEVIYDNVAVLAGGGSVSARLVLVSADPGLPVDLASGPGFEILMNGDGSAPAGLQATFRFELFDPTTGAPLSVNSVMTISDLDRNAPGDQEAVIINSNQFTNYGTTPSTSLDVTPSPGSVRVEGTTSNSPDNPDAWVSFGFESRTFIEFTLETRSSPSGFTMSGEPAPGFVFTPTEQGSDTIIGGEGDDQLFGQVGDDRIETGTGNDLAEGGTGDDTIVVGTGDDTVSGGTGTDRFEITGAGAHVITGGEDSDGTDVDIIDLSGINARKIETGPESGIINFLDAAGNIISTATYSEIERVICFTPGVQICTERGLVAVEHLKQGDRIVTRDNGLQELAWIGRKNMVQAQLAANPHLAPVTIRAGALGDAGPSEDMTVSPNHRVLFRDELNRLFFDEAEILVAAKHLVGRPGITQSLPTHTSYIHLMFEEHQLLLANGCWTESFQPGTEALKGVEAEQRDELLTLFPELREAQARENYLSARRSLKGFESQMLLAQL